MQLFSSEKMPSEIASAIADHFAPVKCFKWQLFKVADWEIVHFVASIAYNIKTLKSHNDSAVELKLFAQFVL